MNLVKGLRGVRQQLWFIGEGDDEVVVLWICVSEEFVGCLADRVDLIGHAAAQIDQDADRERHVLSIEVLDCLFVLTFENLKIGLRKIDHRMILHVGDRHRNQNHFDIHAETVGRTLRTSTSRPMRLRPWHDVHIVVALRLHYCHQARGDRAQTEQGNHVGYCARGKGSRGTANRTMQMHGRQPRCWVWNVRKIIHRAREIRKHIL